MTDKEIDKLLSIVEKEDLKNLKKVLEKEKEKNKENLLQKTFEKYLTTNVNGLNNKTLPRLYEENGKQIFMNGISLYIINSNLFKTNTKVLDEAVNRRRTAAHQYKLASLNEMNQFINKMESYTSPIFHYPVDLKDSYIEKDIMTVEFLVGENLHSSYSFPSNEIKTCNILLNNPEYTVSYLNPILEADSDIGKCYILGYKKNPTK